MNVFILKADIDKDICLIKASKVELGLILNLHNNSTTMQPGIADADLFICDLDMFHTYNSLIDILNKNKHHISKRVNNGAILLCFAGKNHFNQAYIWLNEIGADLNPEDSSANDIIFNTEDVFVNELKKEADNFHHTVIFNNAPYGLFRSVGQNKSGNHVAAYGKVGKGHAFILPQHKDKTKFVKNFIDNIIPKLEITFDLDDGSKEPIPEEITKLLVEGQTIIQEKINKQKETIKNETETLVNLEENYNELEQWKELLWQTGTPLENIVKRFFETFGGLQLEKKDIDLVGNYENKELFIEVKGNKGCIDHKSDFRQIMQRKVYDAKDPQNTVALLIGNPYRLNPLEKRPPDGDSHLFAHTSIPIAEKNNIGLIWTKELYDIVNDFSKNPKIDKKRIIDEIMNCSGIYKYNPKLKE